MQTDCISGQLEFEDSDGHKVVAGFDGGAITSDAGALLLRHIDRSIGLFERVASCFIDGRNPDLTVHSVRTLVGQRIAAIALGYEGESTNPSSTSMPIAPRPTPCAPISCGSGSPRLPTS